MLPVKTLAEIGMAVCAMGVCIVMIRVANRRRRQIEAADRKLINDSIRTLTQDEMRERLDRFRPVKRGW
jgi:hypothetical protein